MTVYRHSLHDTLERKRIMAWLLTTVLLSTAVQTPLESSLTNTAIEVDGVGTVTYGIWIPHDYEPAESRPLILALHQETY